MTQKLAIVCTHGPEDPERATIPFVLATAAQASDLESLIQKMNLSVELKV
jgi:predicted peroxiredoxin